MYLSLLKSITVPPFSWCFPNTVDDSYAVVSEYYGRGLFNKVTVVTENETVEPAPAGPAQPTPPAPAPAPAAQPYGPGAEAKLRLQEGQSKQIFMPNTTKQVAPKGTTVVPMPEGRMRVIEQQRYSSSLEASLNKLEPVHKPSPYSSPISAKKRIEENQRSLGVSPVVQNNISSAISNGAGKNPFEEDTYDETKNPFAEEATEPTNPFSEDDDYDSNYNPFS